MALAQNNKLQENHEVYIGFPRKLKGGNARAKGGNARAKGGNARAGFEMVAGGSVNQHI